MFLKHTQHYSRRIFLAGTLLIGSIGAATAQREVLYEQYVQNPMSINPGFTGAREDFNMTAIFRRKWFNIPNSPPAKLLPRTVQSQTGSLE
jgi:hypothetical protein